MCWSGLIAFLQERCSSTYGVLKGLFCVIGHPCLPLVLFQLVICCDYVLFPHNMHVRPPLVLSTLQVETKFGSLCWVYDANDAWGLLSLPLYGLPLA